MSLFGAMNTAISGLNAQAAAFTNISDNVANSQTVGYKGVGTSFQDYLTTSNATTNSSGSVVAKPEYQNNIQGTVAQSNNPLALAISGQGFFPISMPTGGTAGSATFSPLPYYTRAGDFQLDKSGYVINSAGGYLNGWKVDQATGEVNRNELAPVQISQSQFNPVASTEVTLSANLPGTLPTGTDPNTPISSQINIYDALGAAHSVQLTWTKTTAGSLNDWTVAINVPDDKTGGTGVPARGGAEVKFGTQTTGDNIPAGTVGGLANPTNGVTITTGALGQPAKMTFTTNFGSGDQPVTLNLGNFGSSAGLTQYAGATYALHGLTQNGTPPGSFSSISTTSAGEINVNYDNGQVRTVARVPVVTFSSPDSLQRQNGQAFTTTVGSGNPIASDAGTNGAGNLITGSTEGSNVDIAQQFSNLIVAQRSYSANTKLVTTADEMLQQTLDMKR
jgi:flagellar hook protein FlgE